MPRIIVGLLIGMALVAGAVIGFHNAQTVPFDYLIGQTQWPLIGLLLAALALGVLLAALFASLRILGLRWELGRLRKQLRAQQLELERLRSAALPPSVNPPATVSSPPLPLP